MVCCVTGHRPKSFLFPYDTKNLAFISYFNSLLKEIEILIAEGYSEFISGMANGADRDFAKGVILLRKDHPHITLEAALPYPIKSYDKKAGAFLEILEKCNTKTEVSAYFHGGCMQKRNRYMVDKADIVLAIWNEEEKGGTWNTIKYARSQGKEIRYIMLNKFKDH